MSLQTELDWVDLLRTAKQIRRSVAPVAPSPVFRRHLRTDLRSTVRTGRRPALSGMAGRRTESAQLVLGACLGLSVVALALLVLRGGNDDNPAR